MEKCCHFLRACQPVLFFKMEGFSRTSLIASFHQLGLGYVSVDTQCIKASLVSSHCRNVVGTRALCCVWPCGGGGGLALLS